MKIIKVLSVILALTLITGCVSTRVEIDNAVNLSEKENMIETETENSEDISSKIEGQWYCKSSDGILIITIENNEFMCGYFATDFLRQGKIENISVSDNGSIDVTVNYPEIYIMDEYMPQSTDVLNFSTDDDFENTLIHHSFDGNSYTYNFAGYTSEELAAICSKLF